MGNLIGLFLKGGVIMWPLLICSILSLAVTFERLLFWRGRDRLRRQAERELERAVDLVKEGNRDGASRLLERLGDPGSAVLAAALAGSDATAAMEARAVPVMRACRRGMRLLDTVVTVAPMLGLLGTVAGVIRSFGFIGATSDLGRLDVKVVGGGIAEALITTAFGLAIAIVTVVVYNYFGTRVQREAEEIGAMATTMEEALRYEDRVRT